MNAYLAIWYACNQQCIGCPCSNGVDLSKSMTFEEIRAHIQTLISSKHGNERIYVTLSGGEPTLHPDFLKIVQLMHEQGAYLTILSNAEKFADKDFSNAFLQSCDIQHTRVVTTIHGSVRELHETQNRKNGSYEKTLHGLKYIFNKGIRVTVKHCITGANAKDTEKFVRMVDEQFHPSVDIELWGMDYCGLTEENAKALFMPFSEMKKYLEDALDSCIEINARNGRRTSVCNLPLCTVDPFYWGLFRLRNQHIAYSYYFDPSHELMDQHDTCGTFSEECTRCVVHDRCAGTYRSMFDYFGDHTVSAVLPYGKGGEQT